MSYRARNRRKLTTLSNIELAEISILKDIEPVSPANKYVVNNFHPERARKAWKKHGAEIMKEWLKTHSKHTRPHCFFLYSCEVLAKFARPNWPNHWARHPGEIPSEAKQKRFLDSLNRIK